MHIDISRSRFDPAKRYSGVLALQGRVTLDADQNEAQAIWLHQLRTSLADLIGPVGAPVGAAGFAIAGTTPTAAQLADLSIGAGRMYVDGILVESDEPTTYWTQPHGNLDQAVDALPAEGDYFVYLRVWEREVTVVQDSDLREVALGIHGPDTTARAQVVWQVAAIAAAAGDNEPAARWEQTVIALHTPRGSMRARARTPQDATADVCTVAPEAMFRGQENQLYRVEVFGGGAAGTATVVWSRENGSDVYPVVRLAGQQVTVADLGRDSRAALDVGDLVEIVDDAASDRLGRDTGAASDRRLYTVTSVDDVGLAVTLDRDPAAADQLPFGRDPDLHPLLRRWDGGPVTLTEDAWLDLEDGVQVQFAVPADGATNTYRSGDHWLVPARRVTGDVVWPQAADGPAFRPAAGVDFHYAPLALMSGQAGVTDLRLTFQPLAIRA